MATALLSSPGLSVQAIRSSVPESAVTATFRIPGRTVSIRFLICDVLIVVVEGFGRVTEGMDGPGTGVAGAPEGDVDTAGAGAKGICGAGTGRDATAGGEAFATATGTNGAGVDAIADGATAGGICGAGTE